MEHRFASTSMSSLAYMEANGIVSQLQGEILEALAKHGPMTRKQIAKRTGRELSSICGQVRVLLDLGKIELHGKIYDKTTNRHQNTLALVTEQRSLFE